MTLSPTVAVPDQAETSKPSPRERAAQIARRVAGPLADEVDRESRFPKEAIDALREEGMMSLLIPRDLGGEGASLADVAAAVEELGAACASTALIFAMHHSQLASLVSHGRNPALRALQEEVAEKQLLIASATTEIGIGGDVKTSSCAVVSDGRRFTLEKNAPVISYGEYADVILTTARRSPDAPPSDQVLAVCRREDTTLERNGTWDTLGFRGTCSPGYLLAATGSLEMILDDPYSDISAQTMLPVSHVLWAATWLGIANSAVAKARTYVQSAARSKPGVMPPGAGRLAELTVSHQQFGDTARAAAASYDRSDADERSSIAFGLQMNTLKLSASSLVVDIVSRAMIICGIAGYRADSPYTLGRQLRDAYGAQLMINNDRILNNNAQLLLVYKG